MRAVVNTPEPVKVPAPTVTLELSLAEFAAIYTVHRRYGGGSPQGLRGDVEDGLEEALGLLPEPWNGRVTSIGHAHDNSIEYAYDYVTARRAELVA